MSAKIGNQNAKGKHWKLSDKTKQRQSLASKKRWEDPEFREKTCKSLSEMKNTPEMKSEQSRISKEFHSRPDVKEKHKRAIKEWANTPEELERRSKMMIELGKDPEYIKMKSETTTELWKDPNYREKTTNGIKEAYENPEVREKLRISTTNNWKDSEFRKNVTESNIKTWNNLKDLHEHSVLMKEICNDADVIKRMSENSLKKWEDPIYREKITQSTTNLWKNSIYREKTTKSIREACKRPEVIANRSGTNSHRYGISPPHGKKKYIILTPHQGFVKMFRWDYLLARLMNNIGRDYYYEPEAFPLKINNKDCSYTPDFFLPDINTYIEIKGYWRGEMAKLKSDSFRESYQQFNYIVWFSKDLERLGINLREEII